MTLVALLSWYDEDPGWLAKTVHSLELLKVDRLIAVDGAYALFPGGKAESPRDQAAVIKAAAAEIGVSYHLAAPAAPWKGNEVEKRNYLFQQAEWYTDHRDWYFVIDADEHVTKVGPYLKERLTASLFDVGAVELVQPGGPLGTVVFPTHPKFFRAIRGLRCHGDHFTYRTPDGRNLWGDAKRARLEPRLNLSDVVVEHRREYRPPERRRAAQGYYDARDEAGIEELPKERSQLAA